MQILIDIRLLGKGGQTGVEEYTQQIVTHLLRQPSAHHFHLFYNGWRKVPLPGEWLALSRIEGLASAKAAGHDRSRTSIIDWGVPNRLFDLWQPELDSIFNDGPDLIYSPHLNYINAARAPRILTIHDLSFIHYPYFLNWRQRLWHRWQKIKEQAKKATGIVVDSAYTKNDVVETLGVVSEKVHVIYPGVNKEMYRPASAAGYGEARPASAQSFGAARPANLDFPFILYLGTIEPRKNVAAIIAAFRLLKQNPLFDELKLIIAGENRDPNIQTHPNDPNIIFWGKATTEEKSMLYNLAEVFVYPSFFEGFGFPPLEAQASGCPVVASNRASLKEVLGNSALLTDPWKPREIASAIEAVLTDNNLRNQLIGKGLNNARQFNWQDTVCALLKLFSQLSS